MEFEKLKKIIAEVCDVDEDKITMDSTFKDDLDADSLDVFQIVTAIEDELGRRKMRCWRPMPQS